MSSAKKPLPTSAAAVGSTLAECQQQILNQLKGGQYALSSADKEGYRTLCCYRQTWLYVTVGDEGTGVLRLPGDEALITHLWQGNNSKLVPDDNGSYRWSYELTEAEQLERWQATQARLTTFTESGKQFVRKALRELARIEGPE